MSLAFGLAIYFMIWWILLFAILPFGMRRTQQEAGEVVPGTEPSAPERPQFLKVIVLTTIAATILFGVFLGLRMAGFGLDDIPFLNPPASNYGNPNG